MVSNLTRAKRWLRARGTHDLATTQQTLSAVWSSCRSSGGREHDIMVCTRTVAGWTLADSTTDASIQAPETDSAFSRSLRPTNGPFCISYAPTLSTSPWRTTKWTSQTWVTTKARASLSTSRASIPTAHRLSQMTGTGLPIRRNNGEKQPSTSNSTGIGTTNPPGQINSTARHPTSYLSGRTREADPSSPFTTKPEARSSSPRRMSKCSVVYCASARRTGW